MWFFGKFAKFGVYWKLLPFEESTHFDPWFGLRRAELVWIDTQHAIYGRVTPKV